MIEKMTLRENIAEAIDCMSGGQKLIVAAVIFIVLAFVLFGGRAWSSFEIRSLEKAVAAAKEDAANKEKLAKAKEIEAAAYREKLEYLESNLAEIQKAAKVQDEKLEKAKNNVAGARDDVRRAAAIRTIADTDTNELCAKLAELGHPCE